MAVVPHSASILARTEEFSLVAGGPLYQFLLRVGLVKPPLDRAGARILSHFDTGMGSITGANSAERAIH